MRKWSQCYEDFRKDKNLDDKAMSRFPAVCVDYRLASRFAASVGGHLLTEAQWEYAAKSRQNDNLSAWGKDPPGPEWRQAALDNPLEGPTPGKEHPKDKTGQGVYDMTGNVRELCADAYRSYAELDLNGNTSDHPYIDHREEIDLNSSGSGQIKVVVRGGSFMDQPRKALTFMRDRVAVDDDVPSYVGFRVVIECPSWEDRPGH